MNVRAKSQITALAQPQFTTSATVAVTPAPSPREMLQLCHAKVYPMPVWIPSPVGVEPCIDLSQWRVMEIVPDGTRHFVGRNAAKSCGRVSSEIVEYDSVNGRGQTRSGRVYRLRGPAGFTDEIEYVWAVWCSEYGVVEWLDVTNQYRAADYDDA